MRGPVLRIFRWPRNLNAYKKNAIDMATPYANARMATTVPTLLHGIAWVMATQISMASQNSAGITVIPDMLEVGSRCCYPRPSSRPRSEANALLREAMAIKRERWRLLRAKRAAERKAKGVKTILGSRIVKVEPWPGLLSTVMSPPII